ncbi:hypothetical protein Rhopal_000350-T1 [Rhodotorula paludigena]|uniref:Proteophosphoglycan ppg4 n=1 Tax=Rhodotorula paludigena TaxID=86838 RepID=A0AAV5GCP4_9BASI|nr:hypothetical protein Rhopal_000350-T1 [Rhodotorula paludigena]
MAQARGAWAISAELVPLPLRKEWLVHIYVTPPTAAKEGAYKIETDISGDLDPGLKTFAKGKAAQGIANRYQIRAQELETNLRILDPSALSTTQADIRRMFNETDGLHVPTLGVHSGISLPHFKPGIVVGTNGSLPCVRVLWHAGREETFNETSCIVADSTIVERLPDSFSAEMEHRTQALGISGFEQARQQIMSEFTTTPYLASIARILFIAFIDAVERLSPSYAGQVPTIAIRTEVVRLLAQEGYSGWRPTWSVKQISAGDVTTLVVTRWSTNIGSKCASITYSKHAWQHANARDSNTPDSGHALQDLAVSPHNSDRSPHASEGSDGSDSSKMKQISKPLPTQLSSTSPQPEDAKVGATDAAHDASASFSTASTATPSTEDDERYDLLTSTWVEEVGHFVDGLDTTHDGRTLDEAVTYIKSIMPTKSAAAGHYKRVLSLERPVYHALIRALSNATSRRYEFAESGTIDWIATAQELEKRAVTHEGEQDVVRSEISGAVIARLSRIPQTRVDFERAERRAPILSIDHVQQVTGKLVGEIFRPAFTAQSNLMICHTDENMQKHRFPPSVFTIIMLLTYTSVRQPDWQHSSRRDETATNLALLSILIFAIYACHETPCWREDRKRMTEHDMYRDRQMQEKIMDMLEVNFAHAVPEIFDELGRPEDMPARLAASESKWQSALAALASRFGRKSQETGGDSSCSASLQMNEESLKALVQDGLISQTQLDKILVEIRPTDYERRPPHETDVRDVEAVGALYIQDLAKLNGKFKLTIDGLPAITLHGLEQTKEDIARTFAASVSHYRHGIAVGELYAHTLAMSIRSHYKSWPPSRQLHEFTLYVTSTHASAMPFQCPIQNKSPLAPSASRHEHGEDGYITGFGKKMHKGVKDWSLASFQPEKHTFGFDAWNVNSVGRGARVSDQVKTLGSFYTEWAEKGGGQKAAKSLGITQTRSSKEVAIVVLKVLRVILNESPDYMQYGCMERYYEYVSQLAEGSEAPEVSSQAGTSPPAPVTSSPSGAASTNPADPPLAAMTASTSSSPPVGAEGNSMLDQEVEAEPAAKRRRVEKEV